MINILFKRGVLLVALMCFAMPAQPQANNGPIAAGDLLAVDVLRAPDISGTVQVDESGYIYLPFVGQIKLSGLSRAQATAVVGAALRTEAGMRNPRVSIQKSGRAPSIGIQYGRAGDMKLAMVPLKKADATTLSQILQGMSSPGGHISAHTETNTLLITDTPDAVQNILNIIESLDTMQSQLHQVRIEARVAEVKVGALKELGLRWFAQGSDVSGGFYPPIPQDPSINARNGGLSPSASERLGDSNSGNGFNNATRRFMSPIDRRLQIPIQVPLPGTSFLGISTGDVDIGAMLSALVSDKDAEMLASPHTLTVNHKPALIKMIDRIPITELGVQLSGATMSNVEFEEVGIVLNVTPHVSRDEKGCYVYLDMNTEVSFVTSQSLNGVPVISERSIVSPAIVRDGATLVVGGITKDEERETVSKMAGLGDLPIVGLLFRHKEKTKSRTELMIFVTPRVYTAPEKITWDEMINVAEELQEHSLIPASLMPENENEE